jgi:hypothetical protein
MGGERTAGRSRKSGREQLDLGLSADKKAPLGPERTLEVSCLNCGAKFVAYYGDDEDNVDTVEVKSCGLCHGEEFRRGNLKGATIRLVAEVTSRR